MSYNGYSSQGSYSNYPPPSQQQQQPIQPVINYANYPMGGYESNPPPIQYQQQQQQPLLDPYGRRYEQQSNYHQSLPPPPPQHHQQQQQFRVEDPRLPPIEIESNPHSFRRYFDSHLTNLTFNSKPIITELTLLAHRHLIRMAPIVASCLEEHLRNCPPEYRLPAFYLLDSISKNIGPPYLSLFARWIERAFLTTYHIVDQVTRTKMEELLGTWRTGGSDGGELFRFPEENRNGRVQHGIESALFGTNGRGGGIGGGGAPRDSNENYLAGVQQRPEVADTHARSTVLVDVTRLLQLRQDQALLYPEDEVNKHQIVALQKLETLVLNTQLTPDQVHQIRAQLATLAPKSPEVDSILSSLQSPRLQSLQRSPPPSNIINPFVPVAPKPLNLSSLTGGIDANLLARLGGLQELLSKSAASSIAGSNNGTPALEANVAESSKEVPVTREIILDLLVQEYDRAVLDSGVLLTNANILKPPRDAANFLYERFGLQCKQCGLRFLDSKPGKKQMDAHLDWHFTHKRRIREGAGRAQGRSWLALEEDWIHSDDVDVTYDQLNADASTSAIKIDPAVVDRAELLKRTVVDTDPTVTRRCPICKEKFNPELKEEDEEWVFYNAINVDGKTYHATCHSEAAAAKLASRLRLNDSARVSRENTPSTKPIPLPSTLNSPVPTTTTSTLEEDVVNGSGGGKKRKVDETEEEVYGIDEGNKRLKEEDEDEEVVIQVKNEES